MESMEGQVVPTEYIRPNLRVMATHVKSGRFHIRIMTFSKSFKVTVNLVTRLLRWKFPIDEAREKARKYVLKSGRPSEI